MHGLCSSAGEKVYIRFNIPRVDGNTHLHTSIFLLSLNIIRNNTAYHLQDELCARVLVGQFGGKFYSYFPAGN